MKNVFALLVVVLTQSACVAFYTMEKPARFGNTDQFFKVTP